MSHSNFKPNSVSHRKIMSLHRNPGTSERPSATKQNTDTVADPHLERPMLRHLLLSRGYDQSSEMGPESPTSFTIAHREARFYILYGRF
ncbi:hypothetical protein AVEN_71594-1 [Araneus ventricosus]|uniref:Uncharacterized protein n=1 Tax=Araneus ventricosus TaxID=182803 RepID=A0A4Y2M7R4_ARAVE|nr:hypothetical protein AVEN_71594-1 [Araneus ventricosus]